MQTAPACGANAGQRAGHRQAVNAADAGQGQGGRRQGVKVATDVV